MVTTATVPLAIVLFGTLAREDPVLFALFTPFAPLPPFLVFLLLSGLLFLRPLGRRSGQLGRSDGQVSGVRHQSRGEGGHAPRQEMCFFSIEIDWGT